MPDLSVNISELPVSPAMTDDGLLVVYQNSTTNSIQGALIKSYAQQAVASQVTAAQQSATQAQTSATQAQSSQQAAATAQSGAQAAETAAEAAQAAAESAQAQAGQSATAAAQAQTEAQQAATTATQQAQAAQTAASEAETASGSAQGYASTAQGAAQTAQTQAQAAQSAANEAETSAAAAANSENTALTAAQNAQAAQEAIENLGVSAQGLPEGSQPEVTKSVIEGIVSLTFKIPSGATGPQGPEGPQGVSVDRVEKTSGTGEPGTTDTYTIYLTDGSSYPFQVLNGPQGPQGNGLTIKYTYDTLEELEAAVPSPERGMNAYIGTGAPYDVYTYTQTSSGNQWTNGGPLQGPAGATGPAGVGISTINRTGGTGAAGSLDTYTVTLSDGSSYQFTVQNGANGATGPAGTDGVSPTVSVSQISGGHQVSITDATGSKVFDVMDGQNGQNGAPGPAGADGAAATIESVSAVTGEPGAQASVVNNGTSSAAELVFTLPAGANGAQGPAGPAGADGQSAYEAAQAGGYTGSESQFNTDLAGVSSKQRVIHMGTYRDPGGNMPLSEEQINQIFSNDIPPILVFDDDSGSFFTLIPDIYFLNQRRCTFHSAGPDIGASVSGGFSVVVYDLYNGVLHYGDPGFIVTDYEASFAVPIQLPADPTQPLQAATKQYVDNKNPDLSKATGTLSIAHGGTGVTSMTGTDYGVNRPRGIVLQSSTPSSVPNGCIVGVYE